MLMVLRYNILKQKSHTFLTEDPSICINNAISVLWFHNIKYHHTFHYAMVKIDDHSTTIHPIMLAENVEEYGR